MGSIRSQSPQAGADAGRVAAYCAARGVTVFPPATPSPPSPPAPRTVAVFTGTGQENTAEFTVTITWKLSWSFDCADFGQPGNFIVLEDGGNDVAGGVSVDELAMSESGSTYGYDDAGRHYLEIDSECSWKVTVTDES